MSTFKLVFLIFKRLSMPNIAAADIRNVNSPVFYIKINYNSLFFIKFAS